MIVNRVRLCSAGAVLVLSVFTPWPGSLCIAGESQAEQQVQAEEERRKKVAELMLKVYGSDDPRQQRKWLIEVLGIDSSHVGATQLLGEVDRKIAAQEKAEREALAKAERLRRDVDTARKAYAAALAARSRSGFKKTLADVNKILEDDPDNADVKHLRSQIEDDLRASTVRLVLVLGVAVLALVACVVLVLWLRRRPATLVVLDGDQEGERWSLSKKTTVLGALESEVDCLLVDPTNRISRRHCEILRARGRYFLIDTSSNGAAINARRVPKGEPVRLKRGDTISLADVVRIRFG